MPNEWDNATVLFYLTRPKGRKGKKGRAYPKNRRTRLAARVRNPDYFKAWRVTNLYPIADGSVRDMLPNIGDIVYDPVVNLQVTFDKTMFEKTISS